MIRQGAAVATTALRKTKAWKFINDQREGRPIVAFAKEFSSHSHRSLISKEGVVNHDVTGDSGAMLEHNSVRNRKDEEQSSSSHDKARRTRDEKWNFHFHQLAEFVAQHGHTIVPPSYDTSLQSWVERQKNEYRKREMNDKKHVMSDDRLERLNQLGMTWECFDDRWELRYGELLGFYQTHGHTHLPASANNSLYSWCVMQRRQYKLLQDKSSSALTSDRMEKLNQIGFLWDPLEDLWMERFTALVRYKANYGDCLVPWGFNQDPELARWVGSQRKKYLKRLKREQKNEVISPDDPENISSRRVAMLEEIGFVWKPYDLLWNSKYETLRAFVEQNGFGCLPSRHVSLPIYKWMKRQQQFYHERLQGKKNTLTEERIRKLDLIGFDWNNKL